MIYARYSDDIIIFSKDLKELNNHKQYVANAISEKGLTINLNKENIFLPHQPCHFLGFEYCDGGIDLSNITFNKIKAKIRRKARALYRWKKRKNKTTEQAIKVMIRVFNNKLSLHKKTNPNRNYRFRF